MPQVQTTYQDVHAKAVAGMLHGALHRVDTRVAEGASGIGFGLACKKGTADKDATLGIAQGDFVGISIKDPTLIPRDEDKYAAGVPMACLTDGDIWVEVNGAVADGDDVTVSTAAATRGQLGTAAPSATHIRILGARWMTSADDDELAIVRLSGNLIDTVNS